MLKSARVMISSPGERWYRLPSFTKIIFTGATMEGWGHRSASQMVSFLPSIFTKLEKLKLQLGVAASDGWLHLVTRDIITTDRRRNRGDSLLKATSGVSAQRCHPWKLEG